MKGLRKITFDGDPRSILVVLPTWVGDCVMATPALRAIRDRYPKSRITHLVEPNLAELIQGNFADDWVLWPPRTQRRPWSHGFRDLIRKLRTRRNEWAILLPNSFRSALVARLCGANRRIGYDRSGRGWLLTDRVPVRHRKQEKSSHGPHLAPAAFSHERGAEMMSIGTSTCHTEKVRVELEEAVVVGDDFAALSGIPDRSGSAYRPIPLVEYYADLVEAAGCPRPGDQFELCTTPACDESVRTRLMEIEALGRPLVVLSPGAKYGSAKCWPAERFAEAADQLIDILGATVLIACGPGEEPGARQIAGVMRRCGHALVDPLFTLGELKSLIHRADLLICNDAGPRHIAKAFGVPVVAIFGPTHPWWTATRYESERIVRIDVDCGPCQMRVCPLGHHRCMTDLSVESVVKAATELLTRAVGMSAFSPSAPANG